MSGFLLYNRKRGNDMNTKLFDSYINIIVNLFKFTKLTQPEFQPFSNQINVELDLLSDHSHDSLTEDQLKFVYTMDHMIQQCVMAISNAYGAIESDPETLMYTIAQETVSDIILEFKDVLMENDTLPSEDAVQLFLDETAKPEYDE